jgi:hypothetical protein
MSGPWENAAGEIIEEAGTPVECADCPCGCQWVGVFEWDCVTDTWLQPEDQTWEPTSQPDGTIIYSPGGCIATAYGPVADCADSLITTEAIAPVDPPATGCCYWYQRRDEYVWRCADNANGGYWGWYNTAVVYCGNAAVPDPLIVKAVDFFEYEEDPPSRYLDHNLYVYGEVASFPIPNPITFGDVVFGYRTGPLVVAGGFELDPHTSIPATVPEVEGLCGDITDAKNVLTVTSLLFERAYTEDGEFGYTYEYQHRFVNGDPVTLMRNQAYSGTFWGVEDTPWEYRSRLDGEDWPTTWIEDGMGSLNVTLDYIPLDNMFRLESYGPYYPDNLLIVDKATETGAFITSESSSGGGSGGAPAWTRTATLTVNVGGGYQERDCAVDPDLGGVAFKALTKDGEEILVNLTKSGCGYSGTGTARNILTNVTATASVNMTLDEDNKYDWTVTVTAPLGTYTLTRASISRLGPARGNEGLLGYSPEEDTPGYEYGDDFRFIIL